MTAIVGLWDGQTAWLAADGLGHGPGSEGLAMTYRLGPASPPGQPAQAPPPPRQPQKRHPELYRRLEALPAGEWLPVACQGRLEARKLGATVQQRFRAGQWRRSTKRCETRMDPDEPVIWLRIVDREGGGK